MFGHGGRDEGGRRGRVTFLGSSFWLACSYLQKYMFKQQQSLVRPCTFTKVHIGVTARKLWTPCNIQDR